MKFNDKKIFIGCSSRNFINDKYLLLAKEVANICILRGYDLVFGASTNGMMGKCYNLFLENNQRIYSHTVSKYLDDLKNINSNSEYIHETTFDRTKGLYQDANLILFLPGGTGTIAEIFSILEENRSIDLPKKVILYNYEGYYNKLLDLIKYCVENRFNEEIIFDNFKIVNDIDELISELENKNIDGIKNI